MECDWDTVVGEHGDGGDVSEGAVGGFVEAGPDVWIGRLAFFRSWGEGGCGVWEDVGFGRVFTSNEDLGSLVEPHGLALPLVRVVEAFGEVVDEDHDERGGGFVCFLDAVCESSVISL